MSIDWFTFAAQIVNFGILVLLLRHFLYARILGAMDRREKHIAARIQEAEQRQAAAEREMQEYRQLTADLERRRAELLARAQADAGRAREELLAQARREIDGEKSRWQAALAQEQSEFLASLRTLVARDVCRAAGRVLRDLADSGLEARIAAVLAGKIRAAAAAPDAGELQFIRDSGEPVVVRSVFPLAPAAADEVTAAVRLIRGDAVVQVVADPGLICGIELACAGRKLSWTIAAHIDAIEQDVRQSLAEYQGAVPAQEDAHASA